MLVSIIDKLGGYWKIKSKYECTKSKFIKKILRIVFDNYMQSVGGYLKLSTKVKGEPIFPHGLHGVFISGGAIIGINCIIFHHVTIGSNQLKGSKSFGYPTIGDNCFIGAGAKIIGNIKIGDNCRIGANCIINRDVPPNSVVVMEKARIITKEENLSNVLYSHNNGKKGYYKNGEFFCEK